MKRGFTVIELILAVVVMAALTALTVKTTMSLRMVNRDNQRIADIREIQAALESYYKDAGTYPTSLPLGVSLTYGPSTYLVKMPGNPQPSRDGNCTESQTYTYQQTDFGTSYSLTFCLGGRVGDVGAGLNVAVPGDLSSCVPDCYLSCKYNGSSGADGCGGICASALTLCPSGYSCVQNHCLAD